MKPVLFIASFLGVGLLIMWAFPEAARTRAVCAQCTATHTYIEILATGKRYQEVMGQPKFEVPLDHIHEFSDPVRETPKNIPRWRLKHTQAAEQDAEPDL